LKSLNDLLKEEDVWLEAALGAVTLFYVAFFVTLNYIYDWDTAVRMASQTREILWNDERATHFLISILASIPYALGVDSVNSFRLLMTLF